MVMETESWRLNTAEWLQFSHSSALTNRELVAAAWRERAWE